MGVNDALFPPLHPLSPTGHGFETGFPPSPKEKALVINYLRRRTAERVNFCRRGEVLWKWKYS